MTGRRDRDNPFKPQGPKRSMDAAALVGSVLATFGFFAMGMLKEFDLLPVIMFSLIVGGVSWFILKGFLSRRR